MDLSVVANNICNENGYELLGEVGRGAFKQTYLVRNKHHIKYALKLFFDGAAIERQQREIDALIRCKHPNIAKLYKVSQHMENGNHILWLLEEYLEGGTLADVMQSGELKEEKIKHLGSSLIKAIDYLASLKLVHRDIKPDNIMYRSDGTPVLVDFGLVRDLASPSLTKTYLQMGPGTPLYAAPEQLNNEKLHIDWRTDQFSLGVVLSFALLGIHPYQDNNEAYQYTVDRVAQRGNRSLQFIESTKDTPFSALIKMTEAWQIRRYRTPKLALDGWEER